MTTATQSIDTFRTRATLEAGGRTYAYRSLPRLAEGGFPNVARLPFSQKILLENLLRNEDGKSVRAADIEALAGLDPAAATPPEREIAFTPARVLMQDFTGVPAVVDLAAMRDAMAAMGGDPKDINPLLPTELVIDHSVQVDSFGDRLAVIHNAEKEFERNRERYAFLRWGQLAFSGFRVVPPATGIVHQVNLEHLARVVFDADGVAYPDTLVGTDSHTTMINGLGVLGWGVGGIEAEAAMLGQPVSLLIPPVVGFKLRGKLPEGATATDLVLTVTQMLRKKGVVEKFVEFYGPGLASLSLADRATIANMAPEYGATCAMFPIDRETIDYLRFTARSEERVALVEAYARAQGFFRTDATPDPVYGDSVELDLATVVPSLAGPKRPQDLVPLRDSKRVFGEALRSLVGAGKVEGSTKGDVKRLLEEGGRATEPDRLAEEEAHAGLSVAVRTSIDGEPVELRHGSVVVAAITSCTNTSNPSVMIGAGLLAKKAVERGLRVKPWVKTSLAPGSKVVTEYLDKAGLTPPLEALKFHLVGYGCTTCIGNSGPLPGPVSEAVKEGNLVVAAVLSGNRNFEGRIQPQVRANYLASPPLVVAYALAGRMDIDLTTEPLGKGSDGKDVYLRDIWPTEAEIRETMRDAVRSEMFAAKYADVFTGDERWQGMPTPSGDRFAWDPTSTYVRQPTYFTDMLARPAPLRDIAGARVLALLGDSVTTDHISPAGSIARDSPAGRYLIEHGVAPADFNSYGSRRGNHEVMIRGTFANIRLKNLLAPGTEGGFTRHLPGGEGMTIYDASVRYLAEGVPLVAIAGKEYGTGSSRDWAAKGTRMLGIVAVIAESFERIHRSNLIGMGVLPLVFLPGQSRTSLGLTGEEVYAIEGLAEALKPGKRLPVTARAADGSERRFEVQMRIDTPVELDYYRHGGILPFVLRQRL